MNKLKQVLLLTSAGLGLMGAFTSCNSGNDEPLPDLYMNFSTLESKVGNTWTFSVQESEDAESAQLVATVNLTSDSFKPGDRYVIQYSNPGNQPFTSGPITLYTIIGCFMGDAIEATAEKIDSVTADPINVVYTSRTGKWLNLQCTATLATDPDIFGLYVDKSTLNNEYPDVYVGFANYGNVGYSNITFYGSFDVENLLQLSGAKGFTLHYKNNGVMKTAQFNKPNQ